MSVWTHLPEYVRTLAATSANAVLLETSRCDEENYHSYLFLHPVEIISARTTEELDVLLAWMDATRRRGLHLAGYLSYECGYFLEKKFDPRSGPPVQATSLPLAWLGAYAEPYIFDHSTGTFAGAAPTSAPVAIAPNRFADTVQLEIAPDEYAQKIFAIKRYIEAGDTYQVNFTDSVNVNTFHDGASSFAVLSNAQPVAYSALLHVDGHHILSLSPELFFRIRNGRITTRPMKGTMPRGLDLAEDQLQSTLLFSDEKNRSEHVMIVDLLRNDLGRICRMGSVQVEQLFSIERYRTLLQMTSTISGELRPNLSFGEIFRALFPSGSITGAPKIRTMQIIRELERQPRGIYTGAIGHIAPSGESTFNVAIRTLALRDGIATMGVGGGIVADSNPASEYLECQLKASFLTRPALRFQLIETMLFDGADVPLLALHLDRLAASAAYFDFVFDRSAIESRIRDLTASLLPSQRFRIRLLLNAAGEANLTETPITEDLSPLTIRISQHRVNSSDLFLRHKTTQRDLYDKEYARAREAGFDEVLFLNERDELAEGAISTLFVERGEQFLTPPLASGVLPGILRRHLLATRSDAVESPVLLEDLRSASAVFLGNSVRGLRQVCRIEIEDRLTPPILFEPPVCLISGSGG